MGNCCSSGPTEPSSLPHPPAQAGYPHETVESTHSTFIPSSTVSYPASTVASSSQVSGKPAHNTARHDDEMTSIPSPKVVAVTPARVRSQDSASLQRPRDGRGYPPLPSGDDVPAPQHPHHPEMVSHQYTSGGRGSSRMAKSISMDTTFPQGPRSHSSGRLTKTASTMPLLGNGHPRADTQFESRPAPGTSQIQVPAERHEVRPHFTSNIQSLLSNDFRFRILVVGKRESGKSSLINAIFKVDMSGAPINISGGHAEFRPLDNHHLIVHECSGFGPGELQAIRDFITTRCHKSRLASERLHAVWICVPISDAISGQFDESVKMLLGVGVPLVVVFTKFDLIIPNISFNIASGNDLTAYEERCLSLFGNVPAEIVSTGPRFRSLIEKLVTTTDEVIIAHSRNNISASSESQGIHPRISPVTLAWSVSQRASRDINIQATIEVGRSRYWRRLGSSEDFAGQTLANCVEVIHADIVGVWNPPDKDRYLSKAAFKDGISYFVQDLSGPPISASSRYKPNGTLGTGAVWLNNRYENSNDNICVVVGYIVDFILILCSIFRSPGNVSPGEVRLVMNNFADSGLKTSIHDEICRFIETVPKFDYYNNDVVIEKIIDLITQTVNRLPTMPTYNGVPVNN